MIPLESVDEWLEYFQENIKPGHPLYGKKIFPSLIRSDTRDQIIIENNTNGTYALLHLNERKRYNGISMVKASIIDSHETLQSIIENYYCDTIEN